MQPSHPDDMQFVIDEETASHTSSATESLLASDEKAGPATGSTASHESSSRSSRRAGSSVHVPTAAEILAAYRNPSATRRPTHARVVVLGLLALLIFAWAITELLSLGTRYGRGGPRVQLILMISDGMGPASETMSREFLQFLHDETTTEGHNLLNDSAWAILARDFDRNRWGRTPLDEMLVGASRTRSSNSLVTDSAAGATAFSCGLKTYNGAIGVTPADKSPCGTVLEAAKRQGFATGLVATSRITHATPASFYAHVVDRDLESEIATFLVGDGPQGQSVDIALGGGLCFFLPNSTSISCRTDDQDLIDKAQKAGYTVLRGVKAFREWREDDSGASNDGPVIGLFADDHMDYEIDRQHNEQLATEQPSLREMTAQALKHLKAKGERGKGFFLMVEGSRIDMAGHNNDPIGHVSDMLAYHDAVRYVRQWVDDANEAGTPTLMISVSDHETGGLALARQLTSTYPEYAWYPDALLNATQSTEFLGSKIARMYSQESADVTREWIRSELYERGLGISDASEDEIDRSWDERGNAYRSNRILANAISRRAQIGWSTAGHSGVDVNLYAYGYNATGLAGNRENTEIGDHIAHALGLNLDVVTLELNKHAKDWHSTTAGKSPSRGTTQVKHYHGDF